VRIADVRAYPTSFPVPRDKLVSTPYTLDANGCVSPLEKPGIGIEVDEGFLLKHPVIDGPGYI
jgi:L-alanine-DL-glutamate epimerase-like enolase superfamily enzyme